MADRTPTQHPEGCLRFQSGEEVTRYPGEDEIVGVEVKVSKSDLARGFCLAGCHRNFILVPKKLLDALKDIPSWVGILYFDGKIVKCKRGAKYRKTRAKSEYLKQEILERDSSQIRFLFLDIVLEAMSNE